MTIFAAILIATSALAIGFVAGYLVASHDCHRATK